MSARREGVTPIYNLVFDPECHDQEVELLREHHVALDLAVAKAYGWDDLCETFEIGHHDTRFGLRWVPAPNAQREIEQRLLDLNRERAGVERADLSGTEPSADRLLRDNMGV